MTYQVLARKWRPQSFKDLVGQEHVLQALVHSLEQQRLHHAYLFTGTRGVGKTTIGRILARCLNCEQGISPEPCGTCDSCVEVMQGRFVDLIEIDAASRTKVEDMRELLDNVQYAPTRGRFKIYLIDEVHMLSNSSFNALLKTLEEPPEHVKFLFATTDPQKLPVTILSRCLQFNLKRMTPERIVGHLRQILEMEAIPTEEAALWQLARAADGSMRDALSLSDQAIAYGNQRIEAAGVSAMLGTINQQNIYRLLEALAVNDTAAVLAEISHMAEFSPDYRAVLAELLATFHRIALEQAVPGSVDDAEGDAEQVSALAGRLSAEDVQLFYQTALMSRKDLEVTPDARMGFEMALLRMLAFRPGIGAVAPAKARQSGTATSRSQSEPQAQAQPQPQHQESPSVREPSPAQPAPGQNPNPNQGSGQTDADNAQPAAEPQAAQSQARAANPVGPVAPVPESAATAAPGVTGHRPSPPAPAPAPPPARQGEVEDRPPWEDEAIPMDAYADQMGQANEDDLNSEPPEAPTATLQSDRPPPKPEPAQPAPVAESAQALGRDLSDEFNWTRDFDQLAINGMPKTLASNGALTLEADIATLTLAEGQLRLLNDRHQERLLEALQGVYPQLRKLVLQVGDAGEAAPAVYAAQVKAARQASAVEAIHRDPHVKELVDRFNGVVIEDSIQPV